MTTTTTSRQSSTNNNNRHQRSFSKVTRQKLTSDDNNDDGQNERNNENDNDDNNDPRSKILSSSSIEDHPIIHNTMDWIQGIVIGLNFCPFAEKPLLQGKMNIVVIRGLDERNIMAQVLAECFTRQTSSGTSLMVCPDLYPNDFTSFLGVYNILQDGILVDNELTDDIQIAPFHPKFVFDGSGPNGVDNYTNRSPYPIFHILREVEVSHAVDALQGDASKVWQRNVDFLQTLEEELDYNRERIEQVMTVSTTTETTTATEAATTGETSTGTSQDEREKGSYYHQPRILDPILEEKVKKNITIIKKEGKTKK